MFTYIIWSPQGEKPPTVTFTRRWAAENEARRLSFVHPNQVFHVCKIKSASVAGRTAYFGKWRPRKQTGHWTEHPVFVEEYRKNSMHPLESRVVSEADLIDECENTAFFKGCLG